MDPLRTLPAEHIRALYQEFGNDLLRSRFHAGRGARLIARCAGTVGITFGRQVLLARARGWRADQLARLAAHELAHVVQYRRDGWTGFLARYLGEYLHSRLSGCSHDEAYRRISYEREAHAVERRFAHAAGLLHRPRGVPSELAPPDEGAAEGHLVRVFDVAADRHAEGQP